MTEQRRPNVSPEDDAARLHAEGYSMAGVHAKWVLDGCEVLRRHLFEDGKPVPNGPPTSDSTYYLTPSEWREVAEAGRVISDCARTCAQAREGLYA